MSERIETYELDKEINLLEDAITELTRIRHKQGLLNLDEPINKLNKTLHHLSFLRYELTFHYDEFEKRIKEQNSK